MKPKRIYPGLGDFKNKCSNYSKRYEGIVLKEMFEAVSDIVFGDNFGKYTIIDMVREVKERVQENLGVYLFQPEPVILELIDYYSRSKMGMRK